MGSQISHMMLVENKDNYVYAAITCYIRFLFAQYLKVIIMYMREETTTGFVLIIA